MMTPRPVTFGVCPLSRLGLPSRRRVSTVALWELFGVGEHRPRRAVRLIAAALLAVCLTVQTIIVLVTGDHAQPSR